ncbi:AAA family ATPase [Duganella sp. HH101]|uniref:AAA family ATPase n=1 Tax=Duganella sp. HH101 TaxID=1781066 RepID=UPI0008752334|nr:AAA family ATPase [Duganella sp. HH101]OEZ99062.1 chromosome-partitioning ATPase Soj [Duganella sp. HH101]
MIVAIANQSGGAGKTIVANNLALLRARAGRKVMLVDTDPKAAASNWCSELAAAGVWPRVATRAITGRSLVEDLEQLRYRYNDIVIDTEGRDTAESRAALIAARLVVVPVTPLQVDLSTQYQLIARLNAARMFNPGLRVLFVLVGGDAQSTDEPTAEERAAVRAYVSRVMSATLANTVVHGQAPADMDALYREVFTA